MTWQRGKQKLWRLPGVVLGVGCLLCVAALIPRAGWAAQATLENPKQYQSGMGLISGWACEAETIEISLNDGPRLQAGAGTVREDTQEACGDTDNGFGLLYNWNLLGDGVHTVTAYADGREFATVTVVVTTLGREFVQNLNPLPTVAIPDFPKVGTDVQLVWEEAQQNFVISTVFARPA